MQGFKVFLIGVFSVLLFGGLAQVSAAQMGSNTEMRSVSGEIAAIDVKLGLLKLNHDAGQDDRGIREYRINQDETRVTDPSDKKFLVIKDLRVGQHVVIKLIDSPEETMVRKIIAEPMPEPSYQEITGELQAIDILAGTLVIEQEPLLNDEGKSKLLYFVFEPNNIVIMQAPSRQPVRLELYPGDLLQVEYVVKDGRRQAHSITLLKAASETKRTITTTTTSTTVTQ